MQSIIESGAISVIAIAVMAAEFAGLAVYKRRTGRGPRLVPLAAFLLAGTCLMFALYLALNDGDWRGIAASLALAFAAHLTELSMRWRPQDRS